jgi:Zn-dependent protease with chaperone function
MNVNVRRLIQWIPNNYSRLMISLLIVLFSNVFIAPNFKGLKEHRGAIATSRDDWHSGRTYAPTIEDGIAILARYAPDQAAYLRQSGMPIEILDTAHMNAIGMAPSRLAETMERTGNIYINGNTTQTPVHIAAALYHELVHIQYGDPASGFLGRSLGSRILGRNEEADAHMRGLNFAWKLHTVYPDTAKWIVATPYPLGFWIICLALEILTYFWPLGTVLAFVSAVGLVWRFVPANDGFKRPLASRGMVRQSVGG